MENVPQRTVALRDILMVDMISDRLLHEELGSLAILNADYDAFGISYTYTLEVVVYCRTLRSCLYILDSSLKVVSESECALILRAVVKLT